MVKWLTIIVSALLFFACKDSSSTTIAIKEEIILIEDTIKVTPPKPIFEKEGWSALSAPEFDLDIKYATDDNFTKNVIYPCAACYVRDSIAVRLNKINQEIKNLYSYKLKLYDCYRPAPAQQKLWDIVPNPSYVTNPKKGSQHNKGLAIDVTIVDSLGKELDMGTNYDFFGEEAHYLYQFKNKKINENRYLLRSIMEKYGLKGIRTEWWHFSMKSLSYPVESWEWPCDL